MPKYLLEQYLSAAKLGKKYQAGITCKGVVKGLAASLLTGSSSTWLSSNEIKSIGKNNNKTTKKSFVTIEGNI